MYDDTWFESFLKLFESFLKLLATIAITFFIGLFILRGGSVAYSLSGYSCKNYAETIGVEYQHNWNNGCFLKIGEQFVPQSELIFMEKSGKIILTPKVPHRLNIEGLK